KTLNVKSYGAPAFRSTVDQSTGTVPPRLCFNRPHPKGRLMDLLQFVRGCTFDDFLLAPQYGVLPRRDPSAVDLAMPFSEHLTLNRPLVAANMDTVTRAAMAIVVAEEGG